MQPWRARVKKSKNHSQYVCIPSEEGYLVVDRYSFIFAEEYSSRLPWRKKYCTRIYLSVNNKLRIAYSGLFVGDVLACLRGVE